MTCLLALLSLTVSLVACEHIKFDRTAADDANLRDHLIEKYLPGETASISGKQIRDITYEYFTGKLA